MKILTNRFKFMCNQGVGVLTPTDNSHNKTVAGGAKVLTTNTKLIGSGSCPKLQGSPCAFQAAGGWIRSCGNMVINSAKVLTDKSCIMCSMGGKVSPSFGMSKIEKNTSFMSVGIGGSAVALGSNTAVKSETTNKFSGTAVDKPTNNIPDTDKKSSDKLNKKAGTDKVEVTEKATVESTKKTTESVKEHPYALCDYKNCSKREECPYLKADYRAESVRNVSKELDENYRNKYPMEYREYEEKNRRCNAESTEGNWTKAAHHIISGMQIFSKHPYLVKLANFYGYDVNNADNCILLPTTSDFEGKVGVEKKANGYVAMSYMKRQWHVGGHAYTIDNSRQEKINAYLEKVSYRNVCYYRNYAEAVDHEVSILEAKYKKISCRCKNYEQKKKIFIDAMNRISKKVELKLLEFEVNPKKSYPFFVSKAAIDYAFDVPRRKKFMIICKRNGSATAVSFTATRYQKNDNAVYIENTGEHIINNTDDFIRYAENVRYFILLDIGYVLPWETDSGREAVYTDSSGCTTPEEFCENRKQAIMSFLEGEGSTEMYYESAVKIIKSRLADKRGE